MDKKTDEAFIEFGSITYDKMLEADNSSIFWFSTKAGTDYMVDLKNACLEDSDCFLYINPSKVIFATGF